MNFDAGCGGYNLRRCDGTVCFYGGANRVLDVVKKNKVELLGGLLRQFVECTNLEELALRPVGRVKQFDGFVQHSCAHIKVSH